MSETRHPNFPPSLSITPYINSSVSDSSGKPNEADTFGVEAQRDAISKYGIAGRVWEAAYALIAYIDSGSLDSPLEFDPPFVEDLTAPLGIIELGSGIGVVSDRISRMIRDNNGRAGCDGFVIATDLPDVCPLLHRNLVMEESANGSDIVFVRPLSWGNLDHAESVAREFGFDKPSVTDNLADSPLHTPRCLTHILCSDLVYFPELLGPLLRSLIHLTSTPCISPSSPPIQIVISYKIRSLSKETPFWTAFGLWFSFQPVLFRSRISPANTQASSTGGNAVSLDSNPWRQFGADNNADRSFIFVGYRRPESLSWQVPESDVDLIGGVGARGTSANKGDDTFETLLFMGVDMDPT